MKLNSNNLLYINIVVSVETTESLLYKTFFIYYWTKNQWQAKISSLNLAYYTIIIENKKFRFRLLTFLIKWFFESYKLSLKYKNLLMIFVLIQISQMAIQELCTSRQLTPECLLNSKKIIRKKQRTRWCMYMVETMVQTCADTTTRKMQTTYCADMHIFVAMHVSFFVAIRNSDFDVWMILLYIQLHLKPKMMLCFFMISKNFEGLFEFLTELIFN